MQQAQPAAMQMHEAPLLPELPLVIWVQVLEHVDVRHRCSSCALVSRGWAAAVAETRKVCLTSGTHLHRCVLRFKQWLVKHGRHTTSLEIHISKADVNCLPVLASLAMPRLRELQLHGYKPGKESNQKGFEVLLKRLGRGSGVLAGVTGLTRLVLNCMCYKGPTPGRSDSSTQAAGHLAAVTVLTAMKHLELGTCPETVPGTLLSQLLQLTHLTLQDEVKDETLEHLRCLQKLKQLRLGLLVPLIHAASANSLAALTDLPQLTSLSLFGCWFAINSISTPWLSKLTQMQKLHLHSCSFIQPAALRSLTRLQHLHLKASHLDDTACASRWGHQQLSSTAAGVAALLQLLPALPHLTQLSLPGLLEAPAHSTPAAYAALTASSCLQRLDITQARIPCEAWQHIFAAGRQMLQLTHLVLQDVESCAEDSSALQAAPSTTDLVCGCPALKRLRIDSCRDASAQQQLLQLGQLRHLTSLTVHDYRGSAAAQALAQLTRLQELCVEPCRTLSRPELEPLIALTQLQALKVLSWAKHRLPPSDSLSDSDTVTRASFVLTNQAPFGGPPDVWQQLQQHCLTRAQQ